MNRILMTVLVLLFLLTGCKNTADVKNGADKEDSLSQESAEKSKKTGSDSKSNKKEENTDEKAGSGIKDSSGKAVTADELTDMINKTNDPEVDEKTREELLKEIDGILKQAEQNSKNQQ